MTSSKVIVLEEHFSHPDLIGGMPPPIAGALLDLGERRLREMDEAGIDLQVLSHFPPGPQNLPADVAPAMARSVNDMMAQTIARWPGRFAAFAALPLTAPQEAAAELERAVRQLGFQGAMLHGMCNGAPLDERRFWPVYEAAQALDVPIYLHPDAPPTVVKDAYYAGYPALLGPGWSYTVETSTQALRLMMCGVFDDYPGLKIILGHLGEGLPFSIVRCDANINSRARLKRPLIDYFHDHFWLTTAANFSNSALACCLMEMGADRIMFSVDWPFASNTDGRRFIESAAISPDDRAKILGANAARLLKL